MITEIQSKRNNMWIELNVLIVNKSLSDLGIEDMDEETQVKMRFNKNRIECYRQLLNEDGEIIPDETIIYTIGNGSFVVKHNYYQISELL